MRQLLAEIDSAELTEWMAYYRLEPFGGQRGDFQAALVAQTVAACHGGKRKLGDYLLDFDGTRRKPQTEAQKQVLLEMFFRSM